MFKKKKSFYLKVYIITSEKILKTWSVTNLFRILSFQLVLKDVHLSE